MAATIAPAAYARSLNAARLAETHAAHALSQALKNVEPPTAELHALFLTKPEGYADCLRKMADIVADLPRLREDAKRALDILSGIEQHACHRCNGTGTYGGPSNATRNGHAYCFYCNGTGDGRQPARARAAEAAAHATR
jgi:hypothetical protein